MSRSEFRVSVAVVALVLAVATVVPSQAAPRVATAPQAAGQGTLDHLVQALQTGLARLLGLPVAGAPGGKATRGSGSALAAPTATSSTGTGTNPNDSGKAFDPNG